MSGSGAGADDATIAFYDADAAGYAAWSSRVSPRDRLPAFIALLPEGGDALDLGCGGGWAAAGMIAAGMTVRAMDAAPGLVAQARAAGVPAEVARFEDLDDEDAFDGVWASFCLLHAPRAALPGNLARIRRALRPGGALYLGMKEGEGEARDKLGRFYAYVGAAELRSLLAEAGFARAEIEREEAEGYEGASSALLHVLAR